MTVNQYSVSKAAVYYTECIEDGISVWETVTLIVLSGDHIIKIITGRGQGVTFGVQWYSTV